MVKTSEYRKLLENDENLRRWFQNLEKGSVITADVYLRRLGSFCKGHSISPANLVKMDRREIENILQDHLDQMGRNGKAPGYIASVMKTVRSWCDWNEKPLQRRIKIANRDAFTLCGSHTEPLRHGV
ncbi:MAG: putative integrase family protein [Candidatus Dadabacteria bacterium]|nr:putative integrase family protein [Candidatus Dadabacteria bacterium]